MPSKQTINRIKAIQARLGLTADGIIGPASLTAIEKAIDKAYGPPIKPVVHVMKITRRGLEEIVDFEIGSKAFYNRSLKSPTWPGGSSGVTIGIGYDLGFHSESQIEKDWKGKIADKDLKKLQAVSGLKKQEAKKKISSLKQISIPFKAAKEVFLTSVLSNWAKKTAKAFPGIDGLPADAQSMLLSLIFNRGPKMSGNSRREMRAIRDLVPTGDLSAIAVQVRSMKRIWEGKGLSGLLKRRDKEADIIENAQPDSTLPQGEIILV